MANQIVNKKNCFPNEVNGVTYFKLISNYKGDYTKNCSLLSNEIDANFYFLRGYDIKSISIEDGYIVLTRLNGEKLNTLLPQDKIVFDYDSENGILTATFSDGTTQSVDGFLVEKDLEDKIKKILGKSVKVATDSTINGDGRVINPLRLSEVERTGTYAPAQYLEDLTDSDNVMPDQTPDGENIPKGYRIVTKEHFSKFGRLYTRRSVKAIENALEKDNSSSMWRIPSKCDWDGLLVAAECEDYAKFGVIDPDCDWDAFINPDICPENNVKHCTTEINVWTGKDAGARAKSTNSWTYYDDESRGEDNLPSEAGSSTQTFHVIPVGYGEGSRGIITNDEDSDIEGVEQVASFWTNTPVIGGINGKTCYAKPNYYTRTFAFDTRKVLQESSKPESRLSLRLVRDYDYDNMQYKEYETILGHTIPCVLVTDERTGYSKIWTSINIGFSEFSGVTSDSWDVLSAETVSDVYFINEWNGERWLKKQMNEGDSVVIINGEDESGETIYNHEWRVYKNEDGGFELIDTAVAIKEEFQEEIDELNDRIDEVESALTQEINDREEADEELNNRIGDVESALTQEIADREDADNELWEALSAETQERIAGDEELNDRIDDVESALTEAIQEEAQAREDADEDLQNQIDEIESALTQEIADREEADENLQNQDIKNGDYVLKSDSNNEDEDFKIKVKRNNDETAFSITVDFNFGTLPE